MKKGRRILLSVFLCLCILPTFAIFFSSAQAQASSTEAYLEELQVQGKQRVIVTFKDEVDTTLVEKYDGRIIRLLNIINGLVCEIPEGNIELLKGEEAVKDVVPDAIIRMQFADGIQSGYGYEERDPEELAEELRLKEEYLAKVRNDYYASIQQAYQEYMLFINRDLANEKRTLDMLASIIAYAEQWGYTDTPMYEYLVSTYNRLKQEYYAKIYSAYREYIAKLTTARNVYLTATGEWEEKVNEMMILFYEGDVKVRWNNLEAGLNSQTAWDSYDLDGTGVKIAFLDTGINYTLENLDDNYLGGYDFVDDDDDPMPLLDGAEDHGTIVASLAVGEGVNKVVGVAYNASYYSVRVIPSDTEGGLVSDCIAGIGWASTEPHKADVISMSLATYGGGPLWEEIKEIFETACNNAYNNGIVLVAGSGNDGYDYSGWPARFDNVISVGGHAEDQTLYNYNGHSTNGGVDVIAPGAEVYSVHADNSAWWVWGTSAATPHASALIALQLQYAREQNIEVNNGYLWEAMKHSAVQLTGETYDPVYQGKGKIWAAGEPPPPPPPFNNPGAVGLLSASIWPFDYEFEYSNYAYMDGEYPAYYIGTDMYQDITITNLSDIEGNEPVTVENLKITTTQVYYQHDEGTDMPGEPIEEFFPPELTMTAGSEVSLEDTYYIPFSTIPGLNKTILELEFNFAGSDRLITIKDNEASIWCPPPIINQGFPIADPYQ